MKKSGITLIETVVSVGIIIILIQVTTSLLVQSSRAFKFRETEEEAQRVVYCIMQELKYNYSIDEIVNKSENGMIELKMQGDFLAKLIATPLFSFEEGTGIKIDLKNLIEDKFLDITIRLTNDNGDEIVRKSFVKSWWMDIER